MHRQSYIFQTAPLHAHVIHYRSQNPDTPSSSLVVPSPGASHGNMAFESEGKKYV